MAAGEVDQEEWMPITPIENVALGLLHGQEHALAYKNSKCVCEQRI